MQVRPVRRDNVRMDAPTWTAMVVAVSMLACLAYAAHVSIQFAHADVYELTEPRTHSQRVEKAIEDTEAAMSGRSPQRAARDD